MFVDTFASLQGSVGGVIAASEVYEMLTKIHDVMGSVVFQWVGNMAHNLAFPLILLPDNIVKSGLPSLSFFIVMRIPFLLVRLACTVASTAH